MDAAAASRACRWAWFAGRLVSWLSNTTTMGSCLPDERAWTWLGLNVAKLGVGPGLATLARAAEPPAQPMPVIAVAPSAAAPSNEPALRGVNDILPPPFRPSWVPDVTGPAFRTSVGSRAGLLYFRVTVRCGAVSSAKHRRGTSVLPEPIQTTATRAANVVGPWGLPGHPAAPWEVADNRSDSNKTQNDSPGLTATSAHGKFVAPGSQAPCTDTEVVTCSNP